MNKQKINIGNVEILSLSDGRLSFKPDDFFPDVPLGSWNVYPDSLGEDGCLVMNMGCFILKSENKTILVDTGLGPYSHNLDTLQESHVSLESGLLKSAFQSIALKPEDIDFVAITHLHMDHVGWNFTQEGTGLVPTFPNARYLIPLADWRLFKRSASNKRFSYIEEQVIPLEKLGCLELFESEKEITASITAIPTPGHTPGHTSYLIDSDGEMGIVSGDIIHVPAQVQEPEWSPRADMKPNLAVKSRMDILEKLEHDTGLLISGHFPQPGFGRLLRLEGKRYWQAL